VGKLSTSLDEAARQFIEGQAVFFVGTAPLAGDGHVNVSPKGLDTFRILGPTTVAYLDLTGSGIETVAHVKENGRIVVMFCAFQGPPKIMRLHGRGRVVHPADAEFPALNSNFPSFEGVRAVIVMEITRVSESCGYAVPLFEQGTERTQLQAWVRKKGPEGLKKYKEERNSKSIDGLPGLSE
jgi:hypothetical protein